MDWLMEYGDPRAIPAHNCFLKSLEEWKKAEEPHQHRGVFFIFAGIFVQV